MFDSATLAVFVIAALALLLSPGPAVLYIVARSVQQGRKAGLVSSLGLSLGGMVHVLASALGLSAILLSSAVAFQTVKLAGAAYLIYLGVRTLIARKAATERDSPETSSMWKVFRDGVVVNVLNPKAALFFFAFLPQFVDPSRGSVTRQFMFLGMTFIVLGLLTDSLYAVVAGSLSRLMRSSVRLLRAQRWVTGSIYIGLGLVTALSGSRSD